MSWQRNIIQMQVRQLTKSYLSRSQLLTISCQTLKSVSSTISVDLKLSRNRIGPVIKAITLNGTHLPAKNQQKHTMPRQVGLTKNNTSKKIKGAATTAVRVNTIPAISNTAIPTCSNQAKVRGQLPSSTFSLGCLPPTLQLEWQLVEEVKLISRRKTRIGMKMLRNWVCKSIKQSISIKVLTAAPRSIHQKGK